MAGQAAGVAVTAEEAIRVAAEALRVTPLRVRAALDRVCPIYLASIVPSHPGSLFVFHAQDFFSADVQD